MLTTVEKVIFLQDVDIFNLISTEDLARVAAITEEIEYQPDQVLFKINDLSDSMYMVVEGEIKLGTNGQTVMIARHKDVFGTWALFDDEPRVVNATVVKQSVLLKIDKDDFIDLLADNVKITQSVLKAMVVKLRSLMTRTRAQ
jgi:CRP-like cAMP-binding protein